jgi:hypothetical protein
LSIDILNLEGAWKEEEGFRHPDWEIVSNFIKSTVPVGEQPDAWKVVSRQWVGVIKKSLGIEYVIYQSKNFLLLTVKSPESAKYWLTVAEHALLRIRDYLGELAWRWTNGKHVMLFFDDLDHYYRYISYFYPEEGQFAASGGIFLSRGYCHSAYPPQRDYTAPLVHELTHLSLVGLRVPTWLNEGLAVTTEFAVSGIKAIPLTREEFEKHREYWNKISIQNFWSGKSFSQPDQGSELSYSLAEVLVGNISEEHPQTFHAFVQSAKLGDGGEAAAREYLEISLGDVAAAFLGDGEWAPK